MALAKKSPLTNRSRLIDSCVPHRFALQKRWATTLTIFFTLVLLGILQISSISAQSDEIVLTVAMNEQLLNFYDRSNLDDFHTTHPNVRVVLVRDNSGYFPVPAITEPFENHLSDVADFVDTADVLLVQTRMQHISVESTRAGYYLDLAPLIAADSTFDSSGYFQSVWQSCHWDNGIWALPVSATPEFLIYDRNAFDVAMLPYPTENWTPDDFANAARALTQRYAERQVTLPGMSWNMLPLFRSWLSEGWINSEGNPSFANNSELIALVELFRQLTSEGVIDVSGRANTPLFIGTPFQLATGIRGMSAVEGADYQAILLLGGRASLSRITSLAVSAGTQHPELAYELAKYLIQSSSNSIGLGV
jgi:ABC-type glycerol-3-phosphate transport system substrate-binding protein